jgi:hypothetical protein
VHEIALRLLDLSDPMTPGTTCSGSDAVGCTGRPSPLHFGDDRGRMKARRSADRPLNIARTSDTRFERRRARMPILRAAQRVPEHCDEMTAVGLHALIATAGLTGGVPARPLVGFDAASFTLGADAATH